MNQTTQDGSFSEFAMLWLIAIGVGSVLPGNWTWAALVWMGLWTVVFAVVVGLCVWVIIWEMIRAWFNRGYVKIEEVKKEDE